MFLFLLLWGRSAVWRRLLDVPTQQTRGVRFLQSLLSGERSDERNPLYHRFLAMGKKSQLCFRDGNGVRWSLVFRKYRGNLTCDSPGASNEISAIHQTPKFCSEKSKMSNWAQTLYDKKKCLRKIRIDKWDCFNIPAVSCLKPLISLILCRQQGDQILGQIKKKKKHVKIKMLYEPCLLDNASVF